MRVSRVLSCLPAALLVGRAAVAQDFDPHGRHRPAPHPPAGHAPTPPAHGSATPTQPASSPDALIVRYTAIVLAQPGAPFPLQRLAQLYRDRDGKLDKLIAQLTATAAQDGPTRYAATVALAGAQKLNGDPTAAENAYQAAIGLRPTDPVAILAFAHLLQDRGDTALARVNFERALPLQTAPVDRSQTLHSLMSLALDAKDWAAAKHAHAELVKQEPNSLFVKGELGNELYARGEYELAEAELNELVKAAAGDNRTLAPALKDLGRAQARQHKNAEALATLDRGLSVAGAGAAVRAEIYQTITEVYRADQTLPVLIKKLEDAHPGDYARLALLGSLYEETGDAAHAIATYDRALALEPRQLDLRLKMIRLLQAEGELEKAILAYEGIIRVAPNNPTFVFEMCDALIQRGERARAMRLLAALEARGSTDEEVMSRLGEFYSRIGESEKAVHILARLAEIGGGDPSHLADLGDHYFQEGKTQLAVATWQRMLTTVTPRARALAALGGVYAEHDMESQALAALKEATELEPANLAYKKDLATAFERTKAYRDAATLWELLGERAKQSGDRSLAREARTHIVTLWTLQHVLEQQTPRLAASFDGPPPDIESGRTLAEVQLHERSFPDAERTLRRVIDLAPGDADSYLALERVLVQEGKLDDAIAVLAKLVQVEPKRARETYQRMAQYALQVYKDADAITYAARAVELNPDDAEGHRRLGDMYRTRQDTEHAIVEYRAAITKNERLYLVYFELADLLLAKGETDEADRLFRRVLRGAPDEELVARAARQSMQINLGKGTLSSLEQDLVPLAIGNPQKAIYRRLLVEMYGNLTFGLVQRVKHSSGKDLDEARAALAKVGQRAVKPLLDALADGDGGQQRVAIDVLGYVANKNSGPALFGFAVGNGDAPLRVRAMIACGGLRDPGLLPRYEAFLFPKGTGSRDTPTDAVAVTAVWGLARMGDARALPLLRRLSLAGTAELRALAVLGLGALGDRASIPSVLAVLRELDAGDVARAAAAYALGELGADAATPLLITLAEEGDPLPRQMALLALARLSERASPSPTERDALVAAMADAVFAGGDPDSARARSVNESLRRAGAAALTMMVNARRDPAAPSHLRPETLFPIPDGPVVVDSLLTGLVPNGFTAAERARVLTSVPEAIQQAARAALETSNDRARTVLAAVAGGNGSFAPFLDPDPDGATDAARVRSRGIIQSLEPSILTLVRHPDVRVRMQAVALLAGSDTDLGVRVLIDALSDPDESVQRIALAALGTRPAHGGARAAEAVAALLSHDGAWSVRVLAAQALGRLGALGSGASPAIAAELQRAALGDAYAMVREAALVALVAVDPNAAHVAAQRLLATDPEPRVQERARAILAPPAAGPSPEGPPR